MDERVAELSETFPEIFEKRVPNISDIEDKWVVIDIPGDDSLLDELEIIEDDFLIDLDRYENEIFSPTDDLALGSHLDIRSPLYVPLPSDLDVDIGDLAEITGRRRPKVIDALRRRIKGRFPGSPSGIKNNGLVPPPDALAVYLPFHRYPELWGIYLLDAGVASFAVDLRAIMRILDCSISILDARRLAQSYLFHHEAYHCAVESFALRCELPMRRSVYRTGLRKLYKRDRIQGEPHEETLATAYGIRKVRDNLSFSAAELAAAVDALRVYMAMCPPEYADGINYLTDADFDELERRFMEEAIRLSSRKEVPPSAWTMATYVMSPLIQRNRKYSWICKRTDFRKRSKLSVHYFRRKDVISCLERLAGAQVESGGRHLHLVREIEEGGRKSRRRTQVPSGEIPRGTLGSMLKDLKLGLNVYKFRDECRKVRRPIS